MDRQKLIEFVVHTSAMFVLLIVTVSVIRIVTGQAFLLAELGIALIVAISYLKIVAYLGYEPGQL